MQPQRARAEKQARKRIQQEKKRREEEQQQLEEMKQKRKETREKVIAELIQTEESYLKSLSLCFETFFHTDAYKVIEFLREFVCAVFH